MQSLEFLQAWRQRTRNWQEKAPAPPAVMVKEWLEEALGNGEPLLLAVAPQVPADLFAAVLLDLAGLLQEHRPDPDLAQLAGAVMAAGQPERQALAQAAVAGDGETLQAWAAGRDLSDALLLALTPLALQPFLHRYAASLQQQQVSFLTWRQTYCPVCGREPDVARVDPDNLRHLHCAQCDSQWQYHRLSCVWCGSENPKQQRILQVAEWDPWRLDVCDNCHGYIKTLDQRHGGRLGRPGVDLFAEDARTRQLDILARQQGYERGGRKQ